MEAPNKDNDKRQEEEEGQKKEDASCIRDALFQTVLQVCQWSDRRASATTSLQMHPQAPRRATRLESSANAVNVLTDLVYDYATHSLAHDLLCFSRHAGRGCSTITAQDVRLVARKDPNGLLAALNGVVASAQKTVKDDRSNRQRKRTIGEINMEPDDDATMADKGKVEEQKKEKQSSFVSKPTYGKAVSPRGTTTTTTTAKGSDKKKAPAATRKRHHNDNDDNDDDNDNDDSLSSSSSSSSTFFSCREESTSKSQDSILASTSSSSSSSSSPSFDKADDSSDKRRPYRRHLRRRRSRLFKSGNNTEGNKK